MWGITMSDIDELTQLIHKYIQSHEALDNREIQQVGVMMAVAATWAVYMLSKGLSEEQLEAALASEEAARSTVKLHEIAQFVIPLHAELYLKKKENAH